ncbi:MAG: hypothetical protein JST16_17465 [Bdellovibrionales bacterium]|nr:hypothetical protein [Bdellovibrionales bacterium]
MDNIDSLMDEIKSQYKSTIPATEYEKYFQLYRNYYDALHPCPKNWFGGLAWYSIRQEEFDRIFSSLNITIQSEIIPPLHPYELNKTGLKRLEELQKKINSGDANK